MLRLYFGIGLGAFAGVSNPFLIRTVRKSFVEFFH